MDVMPVAADTTIMFHENSFEFAWRKRAIFVLA
jgi:hypothetical protein